MVSMRTSCKTLLVVAASLLLASDALAQFVDIPLISTASRGPDTWVTGAYAHQFDTKIDNAHGASFSRNNVSLVAGKRFKISDDFFLVTNGAYQGSYYDFSQGTGQSVNPRGVRMRWDDIHQVTLMGGLGWKASEKTTVVFLGLGRSAGESGAKFGDTLTAGGGVALDYAWNDDLSTGFVIGVLSVLGDDIGLLPVPTVDWRFSDNWKLNFGIISAAGYPGVGPEVSYKGDQWSFGFGGSYQVRRFRLDDDSGQETSKGIGQERSFPVFARVGFMPTEKITLSATAGVALGGEIRSGRPGGGKTFEDDYSAAPIVGFQANFLF